MGQTDWTSKVANLDRLVYTYAYRGLRRCFGYRTLVCICITLADVNPGFLENLPGFQERFLDQDELRRFALIPEYDLSEEFIQQACGKGDECYGFFDGEQLAAYGWYASTPTPLTSRLYIHFRSGFIYMYKGFTHPRYRGHRLHAYGMAHALRIYTERGYKGLVSYVESVNAESLRSCERMGYKTFGKVRVFGLPGHYYVSPSCGCEDFGFRLVAT